MPKQRSCNAMYWLVADAFWERIIQTPFVRTITLPISCTMSADTPKL